MLVALHGFTEIDLTWREVLKPTSLAVDCPLLPGHGWSPCPAETTVPSCAAAIAAGFPEGPVDLLGYSLGGRLALQLALDHPTRIKRLILIGCRPGIEQVEWREARVARDEGLAEILEEDGISTFVAWWENQSVLKPAQPIDRPQEQWVRSRRLNQDPQGLAAALRCLGQGTMTPLWDRLGEIACPTLLIAGSEDEAFLKDMERMHATITDSRLEIVANCGHAVHREHPEELRRLLIRFLSG